MKKSKGGKKWRRLLSMLLTLTLIFSTCSINALADDNDVKIEYGSDTKSDTTDENKEDITVASNPVGDKGETESKEDESSSDETDEKDTIDEEGKTTEENTETNESELNIEPNTEPNTEISTEESTDDVARDESTTKRRTIKKVADNAAGLKVETGSIVLEKSSDWPDEMDGSETSAPTTLTEALATWEKKPRGYSSIKLQDNVTINSDEDIEIDDDVTIDLNEKTLTVEGTLVIKNGTFKNGGRIVKGTDGTVKIKGGTFYNFNPEEYVPDGYKVTSDSSLYTVSADNSDDDNTAVVAIDRDNVGNNGRQYFKTLSGAIEDAVEGETILQIYKTIEIKDTVTIDKNITFVINWYFYVCDGGTLNISNGANVQLDMYFGIYVDGGTVNVENGGTVEGIDNKNAGIIFLKKTSSNPGVINIAGGTVKESSINYESDPSVYWSESTSYYADDYEINILSGTFDCSSYSKDKVELINNGKLNISGGTFKVNSESSFVKDTNAVCNITGGTFNFDPSDYLNKPYVAEENADGLWEVTKSDKAVVSVIQIKNSDEETTDYDTLAEALSGLKDGDTLEVNENVSVEADKTLESDKTASWNLNENTIKVNGTLNISAGTYENGSIKVATKGKIVITDGTFNSVKFEKADDCTLKIKGGTFDFDPTEYVPDGYEVSNIDNTYTVSVSTSGGHFNINQRSPIPVYKTLSGAIDDAVDGEMIRQLYDWYEYTIDKELAIDKKITLLITYKLAVKEGGTLNIADGASVALGSTEAILNVAGGTVNVKEGGKIYGRTSTNYGINIKNDDSGKSGEVNVEGTIKDCPITVEGNGEINLSSGTIDCSASAKYKVELKDNSKLNISGGIFQVYDETCFIVADTAECNITGGTFNFDPTKYLTSDYKAVKTGDNEWTVDVNKATVQITASGKTADYDTLKAAIVVLKSGDILTLNKNVSVDSNTILKSDTDATWELNGKTITVNGTLNISDGTYKNGSIRVASKGTLEITGGTFTDVEFAKVNSGTLKIKGGTFDFNPTEYVPDGYMVDGDSSPYTVSAVYKLSSNSIAGIDRVIDGNEKRQFYETLSGAIDDAVEGETVTQLLRPIYVEDTVTIDKNITFILNYNFYVCNGGTLNIPNGATVQIDDYFGIFIEGGTVNVKEGGTIEGKTVKNAGIIFKQNKVGDSDSRVLNIEGTIKDCPINYIYGTGWQDGNTCYFTDSSISSFADDYVINLTSGTIDCSSDEIYNIKFVNNGVINISGGTFKVNSQSNVTIEDTVSSNITGGTFYNFNPESYLSNSYEAESIDDNVWKVKEINETESKVTVTFKGNVDFTLKINSEEDTDVDDNGVSYTYDKGKEIVVSTVIPPEGYSFDGWYYDSSHYQPVDSEEIKDGKLTITAKENKKYYAKFIPNIEVELSLSVKSGINDDQIELEYTLTNGLVTNNDNFVITDVHLAHISNYTFEGAYDDNVNLSTHPDFAEADFSRDVVVGNSGDNLHELGDSNSAGKYTEWVSVDDNPSLYQYAVGFITVRDKRYYGRYGESPIIYSNLIATTYGDSLEGIVAKNYKYVYTSLANAVNNEKTKEGDNIELIANATSDSGNLSKYAITVENGATLTITGGTYDPKLLKVDDGKISITGGTFTSDPNEILELWIEKGYHAFANDNGTYTVKEAVTVTAKNLNGKGEEATQVFVKGSNVVAKALASYTDDDGTINYFEGWYKEGKRVSQKYEYIFTAKTDVEIEAVYKAEEQENPYWELTFEASQCDSTKILYEENHMVTGYKIVQAGILYGTKASIFEEKTKEQLEEYLVVGNNTGVVNRYVSNPNATGYCSLKLNVGANNLDKTVYARAYIIVEDDQGNQKTIYSNVIKSSYNGLSNKRTTIKKLK
jgi:hypothetical protein